MTRKELICYSLWLNEGRFNELSLSILCTCLHPARSIVLWTNVWLDQKHLKFRICFRFLQPTWMESCSNEDCQTNSRGMENKSAFRLSFILSARKAFHSCLKEAVVIFIVKSLRGWMDFPGLSLYPNDMCCLNLGSPWI